MGWVKLFFLAPGENNPPSQNLRERLGKADGGIDEEGTGLLSPGRDALARSAGGDAGRAWSEQVLCVPTPQQVVLLFCSPAFLLLSCSSSPF
eukprot:3312801-Rhodomonas_salina.3